MTNPQPILSLAGVTVEFGALKAVDGVSMTLAAGERRAIIGPNGAGKTTLFNAITGTILPTTGRIFFDGRNITRMPPNRRARLRISRTFQITNLFSELTVAENMRLGARGLSPAKFSMLSKDTLDERQTKDVNLALAAARLDARDRFLVKDLSYGEQRQLEVALALASTPKLLLLDEPAAGLSPAERGYLSDIIRALPRDITVLLIEHDMDLALALVDTVTVMQNGSVIVEDTPGNIRGNKLVQEVYLGHPHRAATGSAPGTLHA